MNVETIVFTGGEPLMYERLPELIKNLILIKLVCLDLFLMAKE